MLHGENLYCIAHNFVIEDVPCGSKGDKQLAVFRLKIVGWSTRVGVLL